MLESWRLRNFKSIRGDTEVKLGALTVFAGPNSSGKSTLLQSILLTTQTLANPVASRSVVLNGRFLRLGGMNDLVSDGAPERDITLGFTYSLMKPAFWPETANDEGTVWDAWQDEEIRAIECRYTFIADPNASNKEQGDLQPIVTSCRLHWVVEDFSGTTIEVSRTDVPIAQRAEELGLAPDTLTREDREALGYRVEGVVDARALMFKAYYVSDEIAEGPVAGARLAHFLPSAVVLRYDTVAARADLLVKAILSFSRSPRMAEAVVPAPLLAELLAAMREASPSDVQLLPRFRKLLEPLIDEFEKHPTVASASEVIKRLGPKFRDALSDRRSALVELARENATPHYALASLPVGTASAVRQLLFDNVRYLGPLRDEPKQFYPLEGAADPTDVGLRGEFTAAVLTSHRDTVVRYISSIDWQERGSQATPIEAPLDVAVLDWLRHLDVVNKFDASDRGVFGHDLRVATEQQDTKLHSLVHVGVGVSQVLPILVMALIARPGSVLIFEQPELHLHPRVQTRLADFLLSVSVGGKQCLVETHSEYLINRLRLRVAEDENDTIGEVFAMYYVTKANGATQYKRVTINEYGAVPDWPEGFFDQSPRESEDILKAAVRKRRARLVHKP